MYKTAIIDYGLCNLDSISRAVELCGSQSFITSNPDDLIDAARIILPGVGAFPDAMKNLKNCGMVEALNFHVIRKQLPFLGICLGMHLIAESSSEVGETEGLGWIKGQVKKLIPTSKGERIPHVGWNEIHYQEPSPMFANIEEGSDLYFVHSYHFVCTSPNVIATTTPFCGGFVSTVIQDNIVGVQFHPEKSQKPGAQFLSNFIRHKTV